MIQVVKLAILLIFRSIEGQVAPSTPLKIPADACLIGHLPKNGWVEYASPPYKRLSSNDYVTSASVNYKCEANYVLEGSSANVCLNGKWDYDVPQCKPVETSVACGKATPNGKSPWVVKVARYVATFLVYDFGAIITSRVVLSTADQFWNRTDQKTNDLSQYWVEVGSNVIQKIEMERVAYAPNYDKFVNDPSGNVAVIVLRTSITFGPNVMPVCLPFNLYGSDDIPSTFKGRLPEQDNVVLQLPTMCYSDWPNPPVAAEDVICTNRDNAVQKYIGTGSTFAVPIKKDGNEIFYLLGIRTWWHSFERVKYYQFQNIIFYKEFIENELSIENEKYWKTEHPPPISSTSTTTIAPTVVVMLQCRLDNIPNRGNAYYESNPDQKIEYGEKIDHLISIVYRCIENHVLYGNSTNYCFNGKWIFPQPDCEPRCNPKEIQGWTLIANCQSKENNILKQKSCTEPAMPGTIASINCQQGYQRFGSYQQTALCGLDGRWNPLPEKCTPICGEISEGGAYIVGGEVSEISKVPWHAGIYSKYRKGHGLEQICGGSIVAAKVIVSALHCFWDSEEEKLNNLEEYQIAVGKSKRDVEANEAYKPQFFKVESVHYEEGYNDYAGLYANDIAIIILNNFIEFKSYIAPVCIQFGLKYDDKIVQAGLIGKVAGWGLEDTNGKPSPIIKELELPVISRKDCIEHSRSEFRKFITNDKFCAGYLTGISVCRGDSGGGLVFKETEGLKTVYFLRGIVSTGANKQGSCDNDKYATFTNVAYYTDLISKYYVEYQPSL